MALVFKQVPVTTGAAAFVATVPPGETSVVLTNPNASAVVVGNGPNLTATNGVMIPAGQVVRFDTFPTSAPTDLYAIVNTGGSAGTVSILISSAQ